MNHHHPKNQVNRGGLHHLLTDAPMASLASTQNQKLLVKPKVSQESGTCTSCSTCTYICLYINHIIYIYTYIHDHQPFQFSIIVRLANSLRQILTLASPSLQGETCHRFWQQCIQRTSAAARAKWAKASKESEAPTTRQKSQNPFQNLSQYVYIYIIV